MKTPFIPYLPRPSVSQLSGIRYDLSAIGYEL